MGDIKKGEHWILKNGSLAITIRQKELTGIWLVNQIGTNGIFQEQIEISKNDFNKKISMHEVQSYIKKFRKK